MRFGGIFAPANAGRKNHDKTLYGISVAKVPLNITDIQKILRKAKGGSPYDSKWA